MKALKYTLMVSRDNDKTHYPEHTAKTIAELEPHFDRLDEKNLVWFINDPSGEMLRHPVCRIYKRAVFPGMPDEKIDRALEAMDRMLNVLDEVEADLETHEEVQAHLNGHLTTRKK